MLNNVLCYRAQDEVGRHVMRKTKKRIISLLMAVAMMTALLVPSAMATNNTKSDKHYITVMGDSVATGFGLNQDTVWSSELKTRPTGERYYFKRPLGDGVAVPNSYTSIVAKALGVDVSDPNHVPYLYNQTRAGFRSVEALRMIDPAYDQEMMGDTFGNEEILSGYSDMTAAELKYMRENAARQVQNSKLVILNLGSNDVSLALTDIGPKRLEELFEQEEKSISVRGLIEGSKKILEMGGSLTSLLVFVLDWAETVGALPETLAVYSSAMIEGVTKWMDVYPKLVARIYELNKDATIVNVGFYNAFKEMKLTDVSPFNIGQLMEPASIIADQYMSTLAPYANSDEYDYRFAEVRGVKLNGFTNSLLTSILSGELDNFSMEYAEQIHPAAEGHAYMAQQILNALGSDYSLNLENAPVDPTPVIPAEDELFADVHRGDWYYDMVKYVAENGYMSGTGDNMFSPNASLSRAMVAQILYAMEGKPAVASSGKFTDVAAGDWYANAVNWAAEKGIVAGFEDGTFQPNANVTREQLALILAGYAKLKGQNTASTADINSFSDSASVSAWAADGVRWAVEKGIISGKPGNLIDPQGTATRAEMATMIRNLKTNVL